MHARYYNPNVARFLSVDPGRDNDPGAPQSWNLYAYVRNNPVNRTDPDGRLANWALGALIGAGIGGGGELIRELVAGGPVNLRDIGAAASGGLISGVIAGGTFGASLIAEFGVAGAVAAGGVANTAGGFAQRELDSSASTKGLSAQGMTIDFVVGGIGGGTGHTMEQAGRTAVSGQASTLQSNIARRQAIVDARIARGASPMSAAQKLARDKASLGAINRTVTTRGTVAGTTTTNAAAPVMLERLKRDQEKPQ